MYDVADHQQIIINKLKIFLKQNISKNRTRLYIFIKNEMILMYRNQFGASFIIELHDWK